MPCTRQRPRTSSSRNRTCGRASATRAALASDAQLARAPLAPREGRSARRRRAIGARRAACPRPQRRELECRPNPCNVAMHPNGRHGQRRDLQAGPRVPTPFRLRRFTAPRTGLPVHWSRSSGFDTSAQEHKIEKLPPDGSETALRDVRLFLENSTACQKSMPFVGVLGGCPAFGGVLVGGGRRG